VIGIYVNEGNAVHECDDFDRASARYNEVPGKSTDNPG